MTYPPKPRSRQQEVVRCAYEQAQITASLGVNLMKPSARCRPDFASYYNSVGLAGHSSNAFAITLAVPRALVVADLVFTAEADDEICTSVAHGLQTGDGPVRVANAGGALPTGFVAATDYYVIRIDADTFYLASTRENAIAGTNLTITTDGTGTQTLSDTASTKRFHTIADGIDTDSDTGATLAPGWTDLDIVADEDSILDPANGDELWLVYTEGGSATLPAGRFEAELRYV